MSGRAIAEDAVSGIGHALLRAAGVGALAMD
jgi:hypothetical protein